MEPFKQDKKKQQKSYFFLKYNPIVIYQKGRGFMHMQLGHKSFPHFLNLQVCFIIFLRLSSFSSLSGFSPTPLYAVAYQL